MSSTTRSDTRRVRLGHGATIVTTILTAIVTTAALCTAEAAGHGGSGPAPGDSSSQHSGLTEQAGSAVVQTAPCRRLGVRLGDLSAAAGTAYQDVRVINRSDRRCRLSGIARAAFANRHRIMIGWPATPDPNPRTVVLRSGQSTRFAVGMPNPANFARIDCIPHNAHLIRLHVGADPTPSALRLDMVVCTTRFGRSVVTPYGV